MTSCFSDFFCCFFSKTIQINIIDDEEYEQNKSFFVELGEPELMEMSERKGVGTARLPVVWPRPLPDSPGAPLTNVTHVALLWFP